MEFITRQLMLCCTIGTVINMYEYEDDNHKGYMREREREAEKASNGVMMRNRASYFESGMPMFKRSVFKTYYVLNIV